MSEMDTIEDLGNLPAMALPVRRISFLCEPEMPFAFREDGTLGPWATFRGLVGGVLTDMGADVAGRLFKPGPVVRLDGSRGESPTVPWRFRLAHLYMRDILGAFAVDVDLFGEDPCDLADVFVQAFRHAGSGESRPDWRPGHGVAHGRWGIEGLAVPSGRPARIRFRVLEARVGSVAPFGKRAARAGVGWKGVRSAMLVVRTRFIQRSKEPGNPKGLLVARTGDLDGASLVGNALRRLAVLEVATRRDPHRRTDADLADSLAWKERLVEGLASRAPLVCEDVVSWSIDPRLDQGASRAARPRGARDAPGWVGSARFTGDGIGEWAPGFAACELLGVGEDTGYGAGQVRWLAERQGR